ncbi:hypothetical protein PO587_42385 [Streptomyces gilvifuscus]|uniref:Uncharacterized protein n=1 Tax=Streptomyces gilvifuscus TaxID=1550617 RepID=A0ABT5G934_9ACTN|nr:hypothetical protein [Streptomyces gilvifuscus]MDC2961092.1 hypothetical protein [Streptomyces gilvifuscus]
MIPVHLDLAVREISRIAAKYLSIALRRTVRRIPRKGAPAPRRPVTGSLRNTT